MIAPVTNSFEGQAKWAAEEKTESLFELRSIGEIRQIEKATLKQIEEKKGKLREIVGESYKDVVKSADFILLMSKRCVDLKTNIGKMQEILSINKEHEKNESGDIAQKQQREREDMVYCVGSRVKYLVDSKERIWGCLDAGDYLEASRRLLRARVVYDTLESKAPRDVLMKFPFLRNVWKNIEKLRENILDQIRQYLSRSQEISASDCSTCLCSLATLEKYTSNEILDLFLQYRKEFMTHTIEATILETHKAEECLKIISATLLSAVATALGLFLRGNGQGSTKLQSTSMTDDLAYSGTLYADLENGLRGSVTEIKIWEEILNKTCGNLEPLSVSKLGDVCNSWIMEICKLIENSGFELMQECKSLKELASLENTIKQCINNYEVAAEDVTSHILFMTDNQKLKWTEVMETAFNAKIDIWEIVFESTIQKAILQITRNFFDSLSDQLLRNLEDCLKDAEQILLDGPGKVDATIWIDAIDLSQKITNEENDLSLSKQKSLVSLALSSVTDQSSDMYSIASSIAKQFNEQLEILMEDILILLAGTPEIDISTKPLSPRSSRQSPSIRSYSMISGGLPLKGLYKRSARSRELEPRIQEICEAFAEYLCSKLLSMIESLRKKGSKSGGHILSSILMSSLCLKLSDSCPVFSIFLGPTEDWKPCVSEAPTKSRRAASSAIFASRSKFRQGQGATISSVANEKFKAIGLYGFCIWARWASKLLICRWLAAVQKSHYFSDSKKESVWETATYMPHGIQEQLDMSAMQFPLPSTPSSETSSMLLDACLEVSRISGYSSNTQVIKLYGFELGREVCKALESSVLGKLEQVYTIAGSDGIIQFLYDIRFIRDILSGSSPVSPIESSIKIGRSGTYTTLQSVPEDNMSLRGSINLDSIDPYISDQLFARKQKFQSLEEGLSGMLDPIDWAIYEPCLWSIEQRFLNRTGILFGSLTCLNSLSQKATSTRLSSDIETNTMGLAPVVPRFQYLPVRVPQRNANPFNSRLVSSHALDLIDVDSGFIEANEYFSFANIGNRKSTSISSPSDVMPSTKEKITDDNSTTSFSSFQEKFQSTSFGNLGVMFSDKAAEVTAIAQQRFGDLLQPSGLTTASLFSSFTKGVGRATGSNQN